MKINEVSKKYNLSLSTLRYYEKIGLLDYVERVSGIRNYSEEDLSRIDFILCMKGSGMSLESIKRYFDLYEEGEETLEDRLELLKVQETETIKQLEKLQATLEYIHYKMKLTEGNIEKRDKKNGRVKASVGN
ncbi:MerR family transcriptional regulator [Enterococcus sp. CWB-B31]|uniref:MerR family transcriptional regulator n=1 Tax=Enterococcus sp. CWB-B31 TaxID=2885159 RepID=UPI001E397832|nr:MerR family transcriptional regulator [Enterococcus sp. CWB-B31]MCB5955443.1 MerR family transcriptional regulator [Enterococcus sp. CWB-B31]